MQQLTTGFNWCGFTVENLYLWVNYPSRSVPNTVTPRSSFNGWILLPSAWFECKKKKMKKTILSLSGHHSRWWQRWWKKYKGLDWITSCWHFSVFFRSSSQRKKEKSTTIFFCNLFGHSFTFQLFLTKTIIFFYSFQDFTMSPTTLTQESPKNKFTMVLSLWRLPAEPNSRSICYLPASGPVVHHWKPLIFSCDFSLLSIVFNPTLIPSSSLPLHPAGLNGSFLI